MTPADRPSVTDNARAEAFRRFPDGIDVETGEPVDDYGYPATAREAFIGGAEWAAGRTETTTATPPGLTVSEDGSVLNWQGVNYVPQRAETTTATDEDAAAAAVEVIKPSLLEHLVDHDAEDEAWNIANALDAAGLLATARTRPTRYEVARAIRLSRTNGLCKPGVRCDLCDCAQEYEDDLALRDADAVLALYADQPTEAEAGARALEQAAEWLRSDMDEPWGDRAANRLDVRAARIRAGGA